MNVGDMFAILFKALINHMKINSYVAGQRHSRSKSNLELDAHKDSSTQLILNDHANGGCVAVFVFGGEQHWRHRRFAFTDVQQSTYKIYDM